MCNNAFPMNTTADTHSIVQLYITYTIMLDRWAGDEGYHIFGSQFHDGHKKRAYVVVALTQANQHISKLPRKLEKTVTIVFTLTNKDK